MQQLRVHEHTPPLNTMRAHLGHSLQCVTAAVQHECLVPSVHVPHTSRVNACRPAQYTTGQRHVSMQPSGYGPMDRARHNAAGVQLTDQALTRCGRCSATLPHQLHHSTHSHDRAACVVCKQLITLHRHSPTHSSWEIEPCLDLVVLCDTQYVCL
jgi:hypothetical protein